MVVCAAGVVNFVLEDIVNKCVSIAGVVSLVVCGSRVASRVFGTTGVVRRVIADLADVLRKVVVGVASSALDVNASEICSGVVVSAFVRLYFALQSLEGVKVLIHLVFCLIPRFLAMFCKCFSDSSRFFLCHSNSCLF